MHASAASCFSARWGDALGYPIEFDKGATIDEHGGPPQHLTRSSRGPAFVSDDTQMTFFTVEGLIRWLFALRSEPAIAALPYLLGAYQRWYGTQRVIAPRSAASKAVTKGKRWGGRLVARGGARRDGDSGGGECGPQARRLWIAITRGDRGLRRRVVGEEALAIGLACALGHRGSARRTLWTAVAHDGDSDSMGSIAGNLLGAMAEGLGDAEEWSSEVEMYELADELSADLSAASSGGAVSEVSYPRGP